jgi:hypothetical protein
MQPPNDRGKFHILLPGSVQLGLVVSSLTRNSNEDALEPPHDDGGGVAFLQPERAPLVLELDVWLTDGSLDPAALPEARLLKNPPTETTGICFSGGGWRSAAATTGFLRGLVELSLLDSADFVCACSGSACALMPFQYYCTGAINDRDLLGPIIPPQFLDLEMLSDVPRASILRRLAQPVLPRFAAKLVAPACLSGCRSTDEAWQSTLAELFLEPYGLADPDALVAADEAHADAIRARNPHLASAVIHTRRAGRPFDIYSCLLGPPTRVPAHAPRALVWQTEDFVPLDLTALYCGSALARRALFRTASCFERARDPKAAEAQQEYVVGGFVESFGVGATLAPTEKLAAAQPAGSPSSARCARLRGRAHRPMSLAKMLDSTSNAFCALSNNSHARETVLHATGLDIAAAYSRVAYWSPAGARERGAQPPPVAHAGGKHVAPRRQPAAAAAAAAIAAAAVAAAAVAPKAKGTREGGGGARDERSLPAEPATAPVFLSDASGHDLAAMLPLLARSVSRIVAFVSLSEAVGLRFPLNGGSSGSEWHGGAGDVDAQLPAYFGIRATNCEHRLHALRHAQVFEPEGFWQLMQMLRARQGKGSYPLFQMQHKVYARGRRGACV